jgi:hypothetical protein
MRRERLRANYFQPSKNVLLMSRLTQPRSGALEPGQSGKNAEVTRSRFS